MGELRDDEIAGLAEKANESKLRVDTSRERTSGGGRESPHATFPDREAVELYEAVIEAIKTS